MTVRELAGRCKAASSALRLSGSEARNGVLRRLSALLIENKAAILAANALDIEAAGSSGLSAALIDRLTLTSARIDAMAAAVLGVAAMPDPIGGMDGAVKRPNGLLISRQRVPLGVAGIIYEARPNVTIDTASLCLKSGNACLLRGGKEALRSNTALADTVRKSLADCGLPADCVCLITDTSRQSATDMMGLTGLLDVLIPRGGAGLISSVVENATVPVIETGVGVCHIYVDAEADLDMAAAITVNAKCSRPSVCNAAETLLVARPVAAEFLRLVKPLLDEYRVKLHGCPETAAILGSCVLPATEEDWAAEYGDYELAVRIVDGHTQAVEHITRYGSGHSEAIVTRNYFTARAFVDMIDAAAVYVNASTRFTDGEEFGMGAEIGISTQKLHARGPMGLESLTTVKYIIHGDGQIR